jgi:tetratricopeptide (TPR) repeat protein
MHSTTHLTPSRPSSKAKFRRRVLVAGALVLVAAAVPTGRAFAVGTEDDPPTTIAGSPTTKAASGTASTPAAGAATGTASKTAGEYYESGKAHIDKQEWAAAIADFEQADKLQPNNADVNNHLGHASRMIGKLDVSMAYYKKALKINPKHLGANEYLGELYLTMNQLPKAKAQLVTLQKLCGKTCEEYLDLKKGIDSYKAPAKKK